MDYLRLDKILFLNVYSVTSQPKSAAINRLLIYKDQILEDYFYILRSIASQ